MGALHTPPPFREEVIVGVGKGGYPGSNADSKTSTDQSIPLLSC